MWLMILTVALVLTALRRRRDQPAAFPEPRPGQDVVVSFPGPPRKPGEEPPARSQV